MHANSCVYLFTIARRNFSVFILIGIFFYIILFIYLFLAELDLQCSAGFSRVVGSRDVSAMCRLEVLEGCMLCSALCSGTCSLIRIVVLMEL